jgi:hypothetical protein
LIDNYITALQQHDSTLSKRAGDIPPGWLAEVSKTWKDLDGEARDLAVDVAANMGSHQSGQFLLSVAAMPGEDAASPAANALLTHPQAPDGNTLAAAASGVGDPHIRANLYRAAGIRRAAVSQLEPLFAKETNPDARRALRDAMARLGHLPSLHAIYHETENAEPQQVIDLEDTLLYVNDPRLARALVPWLHKTGDVTRFSSDRSPLMLRQCDFAIWIARQLGTGVQLHSAHIEIYSVGYFQAAKPVLEALPPLPPLQQYPA